MKTSYPVRDYAATINSVTTRRVFSRAHTSDNDKATRTRLSRVSWGRTCVHLCPLEWLSCQIGSCASIDIVYRGTKLGASGLSPL